MKLLTIKLKEKTAERAADIIISTAIAIIIFITYKFQAYAIKIFDPLVWFWLAVIFIIICLVLIVYIFSKRSKYIFLPELGIYRDKKTGNYFCSSCMSNGKKSPLKEYETVFVCMTDFKHKYYKQGQEPKSPKRGVISSSGWVKNW